MTVRRLPSSFRDPAGYVYEEGGALRRRITSFGRPSYDALVASGLYDELAEAGLLVPHEEVSSTGAELIIEPRRVSYVSYPFEWSFSQLRDAALLTLDAQRRAIARSMTLKDATAYNVQFESGRPVLIDTLSFEPYVEGTPWIAYRQFCQHFLAPLLLMSQVDVRLSALLKHHLDGIPLDLASRLLPARSRFRPGIALHLHAHARSISRHADTRLGGRRAPPRVSRAGLLGIIGSLTGLVESLSWKPTGTEWGDYEETHGYLPEAEESKARIVEGFLSRVPGGTVWDLGANTGVYSRIAAERGNRVIAFDVDPAAVERNYLRVKREGRTDVLPLLLDLTNPTPGLGWRNVERPGWLDRDPPDAVLALALVHHLAIGNNLPLPMVADLFAELTPWLVIEFVPKEDPQVQRLLVSRQDIFPDYARDGFERAFGRCFETVEMERVERSDRSLYMMRRRPDLNS